MGTRTSYPPGTFSWVHLATTDVAGAISFYSGLFGWEPEDDHAGGRVSTTFRLGGDAVCGLSEMPDKGAASTAPSWTSYVTVADADATTARSEQMGGTTTGSVVDLMDAGRTAVLHDPQGAAFAIWQPRARIGAERVNDVGCLCMNELATDDMGGARAFYEGLFGWTTERIDTGPDGPAMASVHNAGRLNASLSLDEHSAPHWRPYFTVETIAAALDRVRELGGTARFGPQEIPDGAIAMALDPQGAVFALFEGEVDP